MIEKIYENCKHYFIFFTGYTSFSSNSEIVRFEIKSIFYYGVIDS